MNRSDFQELAELRLREAKVLLSAGFPEGAYYLAGYAVECALKACIAKRTRQYDFPDKKLVEKSYSHDLERLLDAAELTEDLQSSVKRDWQMEINWSLATQWSESSRYGLAWKNALYGNRLTPDDEPNTLPARRLIQAIESDQGGILPWIKMFW